MYVFTHSHCDYRGVQAEELSTEIGASMSFPVSRHQMVTAMALWEAAQAVEVRQALRKAAGRETVAPASRKAKLRAETDSVHCLRTQLMWCWLITSNHKGYTNCMS